MEIYDELTQNTTNSIKSRRRIYFSSLLFSLDDIDMSFMPSVLICYVCSLN